MIRRFALCALLVVVFMFESLNAKESVRFGVFAYDGYEKTKSVYEPLIEYLNDNLDFKVELHILTHNDMMKRVESGELDIITTNPTHFLLFRHKYHLSGAIATLLVGHRGKPINELGGVIVVRASSDIKTLKDLKGKRIATPATTRMGGYRAQAYELYKGGIDIGKDAKEIIQTGSSHQDIIRRVLEDKSVDVAFVRSGVVESMIESKELKMDSIRVINEIKHKEYPFITSTSLYPEWPVFAMPHLDGELVKRFVATLFMLKSDCEFTRDSVIYGYTIPSDYLKTEDLARALKLPPFEEYGEISFEEIVQKYWISISIFFALLTLIILLYLKNLRDSKKISSLLENIGDGVYGVDRDGKCIWINKKALDILGFQKSEVLGVDQHKLFHHHKITGEEYLESECPIHKSIKDREIRRCEEVFIRKSGEFIDVNLTVAPVDNNRGVIAIFRDITEEKKTYNALKESERLLLDFIENSIAITAIKDKDGKYLMVNRAWESVSGVNKEVAIGRDDFEIFPKEIAEQFSKNDKKAMESGDVIEIEEYIQTDNGKRYFLSNKFSFKNIKDEVQGVCIVVLETTKIKESEERILTNNKRYSALLDSMKELMFIKDSKLRYIVSNKALEEFFKLTKEDLYLKSDIELMGEEVGAYCMASDLEVIKSGKLAISFENIGDRIYETHKFPVELSEGEIGIGSFIVDITERKKIEQELILSEKRFADVIEAAGEYVWEIDEKGEYIFLTQPFADMIGYTLEESLGRSPFSFMPEDEAKRVSSYFLNEVAPKGLPFRKLVHKSLRKDGEIVWQRVNGLPVHDEKRNIIGYRGVALDITSEKLFQESLELAKTKAEKANKAKSEFLANMSHEIRTPMNAVIGLSDMLYSMELKDEQKELVGKINSSSKILLGIINDILDYSKIEAGKLELEYKEFSVNHIVSQLWVMFEQKAEQKSVKLHIQEDKNLPALLISDELRLTQVLTNLTSNALKFTESGEVKVSISLKERVDDTKVLITFSVEDSGIGMSKDQIDKLFKPFTQADSSTTRKYGGTGLGLVITKNIIKALGGEIELQSQENRGTKVSFTLNLQVASWHNKDITHSQKEQSHGSFEGVEILLVEDNEVNQLVASMMLEKVGIKPTIANNGQEGVDIYLQNPNKYHLILMDLQMPILSGYDAAKKIREYNKTIPIIALTAAAMIEDKQKVLEASMDDHLSKPIDKKELYRVISYYTNTKVESSNQPTNKKAIIDLQSLYEITSSKELAYTLLNKLKTQLETGEFSNIITQIEEKKESAHTLIHTLKGVSGNLCAFELYEITQDIDKKYKLQQPITQKEIEELKESIKSLISKIENLKEEEASKAPQESLQEIELQNLKKEIKENLKNSSPISQERLKLLMHNLAQKIDKDKLKTLQQKIEEFEFDEALELIDSLGI